VDVLSNVLDNVRLSGALLFFADYSAPWSVACPPSEVFAPLVVPGARRLVIFHIVVEGACLVNRPGEEPLRLTAGDAVMMSQGDPHVLADDPDRDSVSLLDLLPLPPWAEAPYLVHGGGGRLTRVLCGFLHCGEAQLSPFLASLPPVIRVGGEEGMAPSLLPVQRLLVEEARNESPGYSCVLSRLTETFFVEVLRRRVADVEGGPRALAALRDPLVGAALGRLHADPLRDWRVAELAAEVGSSRSRLAGRFTALMGCAPMQYLRRWRLLLAARQLREGGLSIAQAGAAAGYESDAAFNRAFKRTFGAPPATWLGR
jgi:AraC-like DNA-binding protein